MAKIRFERSGGFLGQDINLDLDLNMLLASEALSLIQQIQKSNFFNLPEDLTSKPAPDEFTYTITVEIGSARHRIRTTDTYAPDAVRPMLNILSAIAVVS